MAKFIVTAPDGKEYEITAPEGATQEQVMEYAKAQFAQQAQEPVAAPTEQPSSSVLSDLGRGVGLGARALGQSALSGFGLGTLVGDPLMTMMGQQPTSTALSNLLTKAGLPEPQTPAEQALTTGLEVATSLGGQVRGAQQLVPRLAAQAPTTSSRVAQVFSNDLGQQIAAGVPAAMTADYIANYAAANNEDPLEAGMYSLAGGLLAGVVGGKAQSRMAGKPIPIVTPEMAKQKARESYAAVSQAGIKIKAQPIKDAIIDIRSNLSKAEGGFYPDAIPEHKKVADLLNELGKIADAGPTSFEALETFRSNMLAQSRSSTDPNTRRLLGTLVEGLDDRIANLQPSALEGGSGKALKDVLSSVRDAREQWRKGAKATILEDALDVAIRRGEDPKASTGELIRTNFKNLYADKKKMKLFSKEEQEAIKQVVAGGGSLERVLSFAARFNPQRSQIMAGAAGYGVATNPLLAIPASAGGFLADKALEQIQRQAASNVMSRVASGQVPPPRSSARWRALVEAEAQALQGQGSVFATQE